MPVFETIMAVSAALSALQGLKGLVSKSPYEQQARRAGSTAASLEKQITGALTRRLAGTPSSVARNLALQAQEGVLRQTENLRAETARNAQRRGIAGTGPAMAQERLASERGIRAATSVRRATELADLQGAESEAMQLARGLRAQQQYLETQKQIEQQTYGQLLGYGAQIGMHMATLKSLQGTTAATPTATAAAPGMSPAEQAMRDYVYANEPGRTPYSEPMVPSATVTDWWGLVRSGYRQEPPANSPMQRSPWPTPQAYWTQ